MATNELVEILAPDMGPQNDVRVTEILVSPGDEVTAEDSLVVMESDKMSFELPAHREGVIDEIFIHVGDRVSDGKLLMKLKSSVGKNLEKVQSTGISPTNISPSVRTDPKLPQALVEKDNEIRMLRGEIQTQQEQIASLGGKLRKAQLYGLLIMLGLIIALLAF